jgi:hypothetical protein
VKLVIEDDGQNFTQLRKAPGARQLRDRLAELPSRRTFRRHLQELVFEPRNVDGHE